MGARYPGLFEDMKFELEPDNRGVDDGILVEDLRRDARELGKNSLSMGEYNANGRFHPATIRRRLGWNRALGLAGLAPRHTADTSNDQLVDDLRRVARELAKSSLSMEEYNANGRFHSATIRRRLGWNRALALAGLATRHLAKILEEELYQNLEKAWVAFGRQPRREEMNQPLSAYSGVSYARRFGSWRQALESFVEYINEADPSQSSAATINDGSKGDCCSATTLSARSLSRQTSRTVSWRLRFLVMRRDGFKCRLCGVTPATTPGTVLVIDHVLAWRKGGETVFDNLQTLCEKCNGGKSDLMMDDA